MDSRLRGNDGGECGNDVVDGGGNDWGEYGIDGDEGGNDGDGSGNDVVDGGGNDIQGSIPLVRRRGDGFPPSRE